MVLAIEVAQFDMDLDDPYYLDHNFIEPYPMVDSIKVDEPWVVEEELIEPLAKSDGHLEILDYYKVFDKKYMIIALIIIISILLIIVRFFLPQFDFPILNLSLFDEFVLC